ncbi:MAG: hypothetical protein Fur0027_12490 [Raineya sp.]
MYPDLVVNLQDTEAHIEASLKDGRLSNFAPDRKSKRLATVVIEGTPDKIDFEFKGFKKNKKDKKD